MVVLGTYSDAFVVSQYTTIRKRWIAVSLHQNSAISMSQGGRARHSENSFIKAERSSVGRTVAAPT